MTSVGDIEFLELREPSVEQVAALPEEQVTLLAEDGKHWALDPGGVFGAEGPMAESGHLHGKKHVGIGNGLSDPSRHSVLDDLPTARPRQTGHNAEEVRDRLLLVPTPVGVEGRTNFVIEGGGARNGEKVRFQEGE